MADILFNKQGVPMMAYGKSYLGKTTGVPSAKPKLTSSPKPAEINLDKTSVGDLKIASWHCRHPMNQVLPVRLEYSSTRSDQNN